MSGTEAISVGFAGEAMVELTSTSASTARWGFAGDVMNVAAAYKNTAPNHEALLVTAVGSDSRSDRLLARCEDLGIGTNQCVRMEDRTLGLYWVDETDGPRRFQYWRNESAARHALSSGTLGPGLAGRTHIVWSGITLAVAGEGANALVDLIDQERAAGAVVGFDLNFRELLWPDRRGATALIERALAHADLVKASVDDIELLWADPAQRFVEMAMSRGVRELVITDGPGALTCFTQEASTTVTPEPSQSQDSSGAGDAFWGTYLGMRFSAVEIPRALKAAAAVGTAAVKHQGALGYLDKVDRP